MPLEADISRRSIKIQLRKKTTAVAPAKKNARVYKAKQTSTRFRLILSAVVPKDSPSYCPDFTDVEGASQNKILQALAELQLYLPLHWTSSS